MGSGDKKDESKKKGFVPPKTDAKPDVRVEERGTKKPTWCNFPGPGGVKVALRVAMTKDAYADISAHAAGSLDAEICGVLAGAQCEDDDGPFLKVSAAVRGDTARKGSTHVTFTHETWDVIHKTMEKDHPKLDIVGWYHSHPGFGVEFSEMDIFIQKNFSRPKRRWRSSSIRWADKMRCASIRRMESSTSIDSGSKGVSRSVRCPRDRRIRMRPNRTMKRARTGIPGERLATIPAPRNWPRR